MLLALHLGWSLALLLRQVEEERQELGLWHTGGRCHKNAKKLASNWHIYYPHGLLDGQIFNIPLQPVRQVNAGTSVISLIL